MVVGEAGLGKTTLLESFFKSFRDDDAAVALFEHKETHIVLQTRRKIDDAIARRHLLEREMKAAVEKMQYALAHSKQEEIRNLAAHMTILEEALKEQLAADAGRRNELRLLRESTRSLRLEMKRAADQQLFALASERSKQAECMQLECDALREELKQMRRRPDAAPHEDEDDEDEDRRTAERALTSATVRVSPFEPFAISVGKHELQVTLVDTPGYGETLNAEESFDVITRHVTGMFEKQLRAETAPGARDAERLRVSDPMVHVVLYFIAPHRLKHIDVAFMRRLHKITNIVPIIAKSDTMTSKEKEEFKMQVREALEREAIEVFPFDAEVLRQMEQQDRQEYKPPWAVVGSTEAHLDAGATVYLRKYPWGNALSSEPAHSDLPALRNLLMWSGQWHDLKLSSRAKYEHWRAGRSLSRRGGSLVLAASRSLGAPLRSALGRYRAAAASTARGGCLALGVAPTKAVRATIVLMLALSAAAAPPLARWYMAVDLSCPRQLQREQAQLQQLASEKGAAVQKYETQLAAANTRFFTAEARLEKLLQTEAELELEKTALERQQAALERQLRAAQQRGDAAQQRGDAAQQAAEAAKAEAARAKQAAAEGAWCPSLSEITSTGGRVALDAVSSAASGLSKASVAAKDIGKGLTKGIGAAASRILGDSGSSAAASSTRAEFSVHPVG